MNEELGIVEQIEIAVDKTLDIARKLAYARYEELEERGLVNVQTLEALLYFLKTTFEESEPGGKQRDGRQRVEHAVSATRNRADIPPLPRARATKTGYYIALYALKRGRRDVLGEDQRQPSA